MNNKIALVHDYIKEYGGAERVLESLHTLYPEAPIYTLIYCPQFLGPHKDRFTSISIKTSALQYIPFKHKLVSLFRVVAPLFFSMFDFSGYDVIIVSATGAYIPNMINKKSAKQICYCHTPPRYLYGYATARDWKKNYLIRILGEIANHVLRLVDFTSSQRVDVFIANSENVRKRIEKFYRRNAAVVYPPVVYGTERVRPDKRERKTYFLTGGRLARPKHYDLIIKACTRLNLPLKVFGKGFAGYGNELRQMAGPTVQFLDEITDTEKKGLMIHAKAFIFAGEDEDFGITPVEAMSFGTPVLAYRSGGVIESVIDGKTGMFFDALTVDSLVEAIRKMENASIRPKDCIQQAGKFSEKKFIAGISKAVDAISSVKMV